MEYLVQTKRRWCNNSVVKWLQVNLVWYWYATNIIRRRRNIVSNRTELKVNPIYLIWISLTYLYRIRFNYRLTFVLPAEQRSGFLININRDRLSSDSLKIISPNYNKNSFSLKLRKCTILKFEFICTFLVRSFFLRFARWGRNGPLLVDVFVL